MTYRMMPQPQSLDEALDVISKMQEYLARADNAPVGTPGEPQPSGAVQLLDPPASKAAGQTVPPANSVVVMKGTDVADGRDVVLNSPYTASSDDSVIVFVSDGEKLVEAARSTQGGDTLYCPVAIQQTTATCNPVVAVYPFGSLSANWSVWLGVGLDYIAQKLDILPYVEPITETPQHYCGYENNFWKGVYSWALHARMLRLASTTVTFSNPTYEPWGGSTLYGIFRCNPTVDTEIRTITAPSSTDYAPYYDLINISDTYTITIKDEDDLHGDAEDRIITGDGYSYVMGENATARLWYDGGTNRWRLLK